MIGAITSITFSLPGFVLLRVTVKEIAFFAVNLHTVVIEGRYEVPYNELKRTQQIFCTARHRRFVRSQAYPNE